MVFFFYYFEERLGSRDPLFNIYKKKNLDCEPATYYAENIKNVFDNYEIVMLWNFTSTKSYNLMCEIHDHRNAAKNKKTQFECNMRFITGLLLKFKEVIILFLLYGPIIIT